MTYFDILRTLCEVMTVSGNEQNALETIQAHFSGDFDSITRDNARNILLAKKSNRENAPHILLDAHLDQVGMIITTISDDGFCTILPIGGLDRQILPGARFLVYGKHRTIPAYVAAYPNDCGFPDGVPAMDALRLDTGYTKAQLTEMGIGVGSFVRYGAQITELLHRRIIGCGFDDKACCAGLLSAVLETKPEELCFDVTVCLSAGEEIGAAAANCAAYAVEPDLAIVTDVNFAQTPGMAKTESSPIGDGPMTSLSAVTDRALTRRILALAEEKEIPLNPVVEAVSTGTNANTLIFCAAGIPTAVVSIPLGCMHSYSEYLSLDDGETFAELIGAILTDAKLAETYGKERV